MSIPLPAGLDLERARVDGTYLARSLAHTPAIAVDREYPMVLWALTLTSIPALPDPAELDWDVSRKHVPHWLKWATDQGPDGIATLARVTTWDQFNSLAVTGWRCHTLPEDTRHAWVTAAHRMAETAHGNRPEKPGATINAWVKSGADPAHALALADTAAPFETVSGWTYGPDVTVDQFVAVATAGITDLGAYTSTGLTLDQAVAVTSAGVTPGEAVLGHELGIPTDQWADTFAGWDRTWAPTDDGYPRPMAAVGRSALAHGYTLDDLSWLAQHGWNTLSRYAMEYGLKHRLGRACTPAKFTPDTARACAEAGFTPADAAHWMDVLTTGTHPGRWNGLPPILRSTTLVDDTFIEHITWLRDRGVNPSHIATYRAAGCTTMDDLREAVNAGISGPDCKRLLGTYGTRRSSKHDPLRIATVTDLIEAAIRDQDTNA